MILTKDSWENGMHTRYSYYLSDKGEEVLQGKKTIQSRNMVAETEYRDGKLISSEMKASFR